MALEVRFTLEADEDLESLSDFSFEKFGSAQASRYRKAIGDAIQLLGQFPQLGQEAPEVRLGLRRHVHGVHAIYYRVHEDYIVIGRILGPGQDPTREFEP